MESAGVLRVVFHGFWPGFCAEDFFLPILRASSGMEVLEAPHGEKHDLLIESVFIHKGRSNLLIQAARRVVRKLIDSSPKREAIADEDTQRLWYSGENQRPPEGFLRTLSFDPTTGVNFRLPLWWLLFPAPGSRSKVVSETGRIGLQPLLSEALEGRTISSRDERTEFACTFVGKPEKLRLEMINALESVGVVDKYGAFFRNPVVHKQPVASRYKFVICPENSLYPGYVTEKALEAWACGAIPLYAGNDNWKDLNDGALLNLQNFDSMRDFCEAVAHLARDDSSMREMRQTNILNNPPDYRGLTDFLAEALDQVGLNIQR